MLTTVLLGELLERGVKLQPEEVVAMAQGLADITAGFATTPVACTTEGGVRLKPEAAEDGRALLSAVQLTSDGRLIWSGPRATPSVHACAAALHALLETTPRVPGALRYIIARALRTVDAPGFASLAEFSNALRRFAPTDGRASLRNLALRSQATASTPSTSWLIAAGDRRRVSPQVTELRRQLQDADRRHFELVVAKQVVPNEPAPSVRPPAAAVFSPEIPAIPAAVAAIAPHRRRQGLALAMAASVAVVLSGVSGFLLVSRATPHSTVATALSRPSPAQPEPESAVTASALPAVPLDAAPAAAPPASASVSAVSSGVATSAARTAPTAASPEPLVDNAPTAADSRADSSRLSAAAALAGDADGMMVTALDLQQRPVFSPAFAQTESAIFFHTGRDGAARSALARATEDEGTGELRVVTLIDDGSRNYHVQPSPDGRLIAFDSDRDGERGVYVANQDGSGVRRVSGPGYAAVPSWSPDGRRLAYVRAEPDDPRVWNLWLLPLGSVPTRGTNDVPAQRLTEYAYGQTWAASWFSDGQHVCYTHEDEIVVLDLLTGRARTFKSPVRGSLVRTPAVSPDGTTVIFQVFRNGGWLLHLDDESMTRVIDDPSAQEFAWSPNGRRVAYHSRRDGEWGIFVYAGH